jgi:CHAD domain-containing protein
VSDAKSATGIPSSEPSGPVPSEFPTAEKHAVARPAEWTPGSAHDWTKVRKLALGQMNRFISLEPKVLKGNKPNAVHDMRVASRRLQQLLDLLYPAPPKEIRRLRRRIKSCRRALSEVRNCDVQLKRARKSLGSKRRSSRETWEAIAEYLAERRSESFGKALRKLGKLNLAVAYVSLKERLERNGVSQAEDGQDGARSQPLPSSREYASESFHGRFRAALGKVWQAYEAQVGESPRDADTPALHGVRVAAKRVRYLVEVLRELDVAGSAEVLSWLRQLQRHLGDWHDLEVLEQMLVEMVARPKFLRNHLDIAIGVEKLILRNRTAKKRYVEKYFRMTLDSPESRFLNEWVASLVSGSVVLEGQNPDPC